MWVLTYVFDWLYFTWCLNSSSLIVIMIFFIFMQFFFSISSNINEVLSINPSPKCLSLDILTSIIWTGWPVLVELIDLVNSVTNYLTQMVNFPIWIPGCDSHSPALLDLFLSSQASVCSTMSFLPLGNSDHVVVLVSIDIPTSSKGDAYFHHIDSDYSCANWDVLQCLCCC